ncbi:MAG: exosortase F system-associated protein [Salegentibacter sp.]
MTMKSRYRSLGIALLVGLLVLIRFYEQSLFYDPLIRFYDTDYLHGTVPELYLPKLLFFLMLRFSLNSLISLVIIYVAFLDKEIVKFSAILFLVLFLVGGTVLSIMLFNMDSADYMAIFYVRRFLIHPVFVLILLPAFYYYRLQQRRRNRAKEGTDQF